MNADAVLSLLPHSYVGIATSVIALCAAFVAAVPAPVAPTTWYGKAGSAVWRGIDFIALNFAHGTTTSKAVADGAVVPIAVHNAVVDNVVAQAQSNPGSKPVAPVVTPSPS